MSNDIDRENQASSPVQITGGNELFKADVVNENGNNKLLVKSTSLPEAIGDIFFDYALNGTSNEMAVNGQGTPVTFTIPALSLKRRVVAGLKFHAFANGIKLQNFLSQNNALNNGILVEIKSGDKVFQFNPIRTTADFDNEFTLGQGSEWTLTFGSGGDYMSAEFSPVNPFVIEPQGAYATDDYIRVIIRDNLSNITSLKMKAYGSRVDAI